MKNSLIDMYEQYCKEDIEKNERINREIARKIEEDNAFNSYRFDPAQVKYSL